jgi:hypothetical protein
MKKLIILILLALSFIGCDPESCVDYQIQNLSSSKIKVKPFINGVNTFYEIESLAINTQLSNCGTGSNPAILLYTNDSIQILVDNVVKKTYYPNDTGKSIFKTQDRDSWKLVESKEHYSKFVFEITEEDLQ